MTVRPYTQEDVHTAGILVAIPRGTFDVARAEPGQVRPALERARRADRCLRNSNNGQSLVQIEGIMKARVRQAGMA